MFCEKAYTGLPDLGIAMVEEFNELSGSLNSVKFEELGMMLKYLLEFCGHIKSTNAQVVCEVRFLR